MVLLILLSHFVYRIYTLTWPSFMFINAGPGSYIPEGLMTSCTWDYVSPSPANRSYTMMLCCFVFFIPLTVILYCYLLMFLSVRQAGRCVFSSPLFSLSGCDGSVISVMVFCVCSEIWTGSLRSLVLWSSSL